MVGLLVIARLLLQFLVSSNNVMHDMMQSELPRPIPGILWNRPQKYIDDPL